MSRNFRAFSTSSDSDFFLALATGVVESEAGLAVVDAGDALDFLLPSGFVALFLDLFLAEELAADPDGTDPS